MKDDDDVEKNLCSRLQYIYHRLDMSHHADLHASFFFFWCVWVWC